MVEKYLSSIYQYWTGWDLSLICYIVWNNAQHINHKFGIVGGTGIRKENVVNMGWGELCSVEY